MMANILIIVVIYKTRPEDSSTVLSLLECSRYFGNKIRVVVYDNSPAGNFCIDNDDFEYFAVENNQGLACAYNYGLRRAIDGGSLLLVTLDQDSIVSVDYIKALCELVIERDSDVAVFCPDIVASGCRISPYYFDWKGRPRFDEKIAPSEAINSFSAYSVSHLRRLGGFDEFYWLDALDFSSFARIERAGWRIGKIPVTVAHDLSVVSGNVPLWRLKNIAWYESCFLAEYAGFFRLIVGSARLLVRSARLLLMIGQSLDIFSIAGSMLLGTSCGVRRRSRQK